MKLLLDCCEAYSRFGIRQYNRVLSFIRPTKKAIAKYKELKYGLNYKILHALDEQIKLYQHSDLPVYCSFGIYHPTLDDKFRVAFEIVQVIRYNIACANAKCTPEERPSYVPKYGTIDFNRPHSCTNVPLPKCELIQNEGNV